VCAGGFHNGSAAILISLFGTSNDDFCTFRLEKSLLTWTSVTGDIVYIMEDFFF